LAAAPAKANTNTLLRYLHRLFAWGRRHGHCQTNPAAGAKRLAVRARHGMPSRVAYDAVLSFAKSRGAQPPHSAGSLAPHLGPLMEIKYLCRMRSIEVLGLAGAHASEQGIYVARRKGSDDNIVRWSPRLRAAGETAVGVRATIRARRSNKAATVPAPERRFIFMTETVTRLSASALSTSWGQLMRAAVESRHAKRANNMPIFLDHFRSSSQRARDLLNEMRVEHVQSSGRYRCIRFSGEHAC
jgi:hypothetical protein